MIWQFPKWFASALGICGKFRVSDGGDVMH